MQKQTQLSEMPVAILIITIIFMLGLLMGTLYYFAENVVKSNPSIVVAPIEEEVIITTDKLEYEQGEKLKVTIKNNSDNSVWYFFEIYSNNLKLMGYKNKQWTVVPMLPSSPLPPGHIPEYLELKPNESAILEYAPESVIDKKFLDYEKYKLSFSYEKNKYSKSQIIIYSNEFTIREKQSGVIIKTDKAEFEQGEEIAAVLDYNDYKSKIYYFGRYAWSIQKLENGLWIDIQREGDPGLICGNIPSCNGLNLNEIRECSNTVFCERDSWYEINDFPKLVWNQSYKSEEKPFSCDFIERHPRTKDIISSKTENRFCAVFSKAQLGNYKIRFEYATDINMDNLFDRNIDIKYAEKEFTIK